MRKQVVALIAVTIMVLLAAVAGRAQYTPGGGFTGSPHDFSGRAAGSATTGACTFCHTPHRAIQQSLLWNHTLNTNAYSWEAGAKTAGGTEYPTIDTSWKGPSKLCLSCHDGSVAIGDIAWFNKQAWQVAGGGTALDTTKHDTDVFHITAPGATGGAGSMRGNHPVAFPYPFGKTTTNIYNGKQTGAATYVADFNTDPQTLGIRLFNDDGGVVSAGAVAGKTGIECTSCHGVHNETGLVYGQPLLRGTIGGTGTGAGASYICMKCHTR